MGLICVGFIPLVALVKVLKAERHVDDLKREVQRLRDQLDGLTDRFAGRTSASGPLGQAARPTETKQAALAKPEPKHFSLPSDSKESRAARLAEKQKKTPAPKPASVLPPIIESPKTVPHVEPAAKPSESAKPEKAVATAQAGMPRLPKVDAESIEMKLGTYWFVRIGVMLVLTALGFLAYHTKGFGFIELSPGAKVSLFYLLSAAMGGVGFWLQRTKEQLKNYGQVLLAGGFAAVYFT
ncbi:MAG TPA: hypothetical protein QGG93_05810, partial [Verrucomicrobiota bacterium]|nr:hypothetical protein [Verrucomicrobiota bacterium]